MPGFAGGRLKGELPRAERPLEFLVINDHHHALSARDSSLPGSGNVTAIAVGEIFDARDG